MRVKQDSRHLTNGLIIDWQYNKKDNFMDTDRRNSLWDEKYNTGIAVIDWQHKTIYAAIENICQTEIFTEEEIKEVFDFIYCYILDHHATEELYMKLHGFPKDLIKAHQLTHSNIRKQLFDARQTIKEDSCKEIGCLLKNILSQHILKEDMLYVDYLNLHKNKTN